MTIASRAREAEAVPGIDYLELPSRRRVWGVALSLFTVTGALRFTYMYFDDVARREGGTLVRRAIEESTGAYTAAVLFVAVVAFVWRYPLDRPGWRARVPAHVAALVAYFHHAHDAHVPDPDRDLSADRHGGLRLRLHASAICDGIWRGRDQ